jgi:hypothetical protein
LHPKRTLPTITFELEFYDEPPTGREPVRDWLDQLDDLHRAAALRGLSLVLAAVGPQVCRSEYGKALGGGLYEFRIRHDAEEILRAHSPQLLDKLGPLPTGPVMLRIFFGCLPDRVILLLGAYDKGSAPSRRRQQVEIGRARARLAEYRSRNAHSAATAPSRSFRRWWISQVRRGQRRQDGL